MNGAVTQAYTHLHRLRLTFNNFIAGFYKMEFRPSARISWENEIFKTTEFNNNKKKYSSERLI